MPANSLATVLYDRLGWTEEYLAEINDPTHPVLKDTDAMVAALHEIRAAGAKIVVLPDFDTDGVTSGVIAFVGLRQLGFDAAIHFPDYRHGHDITPVAVDELAARFPDARAILTTDAGTNSHAGIARAKSLVGTVLVTDHHQQLPSDTPLAADVLVNPFRLDETYPHPGICGAHVIFQVVKSYAARHDPAQTPFLDRLALFAGLGTVADVMPMLHENRDLVRRSNSLARLMYHPDDYRESALYAIIDHDFRKRLVCREYADAFCGFGQLLDALRDAGSIRDPFIREDLAGFYIAPAVNSARRVLSDGANAFRVFVGSDPTARKAAIDAIIADNERRKLLTEEWMAELGYWPQPFAPHVWLSGAPSGFLGLLAGKLCDRHDVPTVVVRDDGRGGFSGSARAPIGADVIAGFAGLDGVSAIGHAQACGVSADSRDALIVMADALHAIDGSRERPDEDAPFPGLVLGDCPDTDAARPDLEELLALVDQIQGQAPFGHGFPEPLHKIAIDPNRALIDPLGNDGRHTRITCLNTGLKLLWWNSAEERGRLPRPGDHRPLVFLVTLGANTFNNVTRPQAVIRQRLA